MFVHSYFGTIEENILKEYFSLCKLKEGEKKAKKSSETNRIL